MNKKHLTWAILHGAMLGLFMLRASEPKREVFFLQPDSEGTYNQVIESDDFKVEVREYESRALDVSFVPRVKMDHYLWAIVFGFLVASHHYEVLKKNEKRKAEEDVFSSALSHTPNEDPLYEEFLKEDANRRLFPRPHLEEDFQAWQVERDSVGETQA